ncbi:hypothetical protein LXA43DRAFT_1050176 [Ganoderma leucocontextum]|nr:hypothetical protein LXA43DRAFT_1050176 [Ganoderma leucocontextum]
MYGVRAVTRWMQWLARTWTAACGLYWRRSPHSVESQLHGGRCVLDIPHRFITMDLDNIPHTFERPGRSTDRYWQDGYRNLT